MKALAHDWTTEAIEAHMAGELAKAPPPNMVWYFHNSIRAINQPLYMNADMFGYVCYGLALLLGFAASVLFIGEFITAHANPAYPRLFAIAAALAAIGTTLQVVHWLASLVNRIQVRPPAKWITKTAEQYGIGKMPPLAQRLIRDLRQLQPGALVTVHELRQGTFTLDPILEINGQYVLVWDADGTIVPPPA